MPSTLRYQRLLEEYRYKLGLLKAKREREDFERRNKLGQLTTQEKQNILENQQKEVTIQKSQEDVRKGEVERGLISESAGRYGTPEASTADTLMVGKGLGLEPYKYLGTLRGEKPQELSIAQYRMRLAKNPNDLEAKQIVDEYDRRQAETKTKYAEPPKYNPSQALADSIANYQFGASRNVPGAGARLLEIQTAKHIGTKPEKTRSLEEAAYGYAQKQADITKDIEALLPSGRQPSGITNYPDGRTKISFGNQARQKVIPEGSPAEKILKERYAAYGDSIKLTILAKELKYVNMDKFIQDITEAENISKQYYQIVKTKSPQEAEQWLKTTTKNPQMTGEILRKLVDRINLAKKRD